MQLMFEYQDIWNSKLRLYGTNLSNTTHTSSKG